MTNRKDTSSNSEPQKKPFDPTGAMQGSDFLKAVKAQFFNSDESSNWPEQSEEDSEATPIELAGNQLSDALEKLFHSAMKGTPLPAAPETDAAAVLRRLKAAAVASKWPTDAAKIPADWPTDLRADYRLYEVACAANLIIRAFAGRDGGGGPRNWPPPP